MARTGSVWGGFVQSKLNVRVSSVGCGQRLVGVRIAIPVDEAGHEAVEWRAHRRLPFGSSNDMARYETRRATSTGGHSAEASTLNNDATGSRTVTTRSPGANRTYLLHFQSRKRATYPPYDPPIVGVCTHLPPSFPTPSPCARIAT